MNRRTFLQSAIALGTLSPWLVSAAEPPRYLVLIELSGGNDGINTVIPFRDPLYRKLRPNLALNAQQVLPISAHLALHPSLEPLIPLWKNGNMAVVQGVGYPEPNRSHFRSIDIWNTASDSDEVLQKGWLASTTLKRGSLLADGMILGGEAGPLLGSNNILTIRNMQQFQNSLKRLPPPPTVTTRNTALDHLLTIRHNLERASADMAERMKPLPPNVSFPENSWGQQARLACRVILSGLNIPVIKISLGGFDTHANQLNQHRVLLKQLGEMVAGLSKVLTPSGEWNNVTIMTYSEFGRRVAENGSRGTDHGTSAPHFVWGGKIAGGLYGKYPSLQNLQDDDLLYHADFRSLYVTILTDWCRIRNSRLEQEGFRSMGFIKT